MRNKLSPNGDAIRTIRQLKGWNLRTFAARVGVSESHLGNVECDRRGLALDKLLLIARELDVPIGVITKTKSPDPKPAPYRSQPDPKRHRPPLAL